MRYVLCIILMTVCTFAYSREGAKNWKAKTENADYIHRAIKKVTDIMVYDIYSPPVASRTYAYITVAGYEAAINADPKYVSFAGQLQGLTPAPKPDKNKQYSFTLASAYAILTVGKSLVISEGRINAFLDELTKEFKDAGMPDEVFNNSVEYGKKVAAHILDWAAKDKYKETRAMAKYAVRDDDPGAWKPTPPAYIKAIEPNWNKMRTFLMDSAQQFKPKPATSFGFDSSSQFYKEALAVRNAVSNITDEQSAIAQFWDCNPFKMNVRGHVMYATKKISPNGHWINITRITCKKENADLVRSAEAYACLAVTLADCFISCWDEKYRSQSIRPETYINQYIDPDWTPLLQTPPFPEYTSGHSVVSSAAAVVLTKLFGDHFSFVDSTELEFGLPPRTFRSFNDAAHEAAISRFYGGIHYMPAITNGFEEGTGIGQFAINKLKMRKEEVAKK
ncbi:vanadium-dependent haloperoxidase [Ilyomonas limi]|uniref:Vanadium-dependent haloperoxidase n=1 Tax=Ilyomonas limi TaxID=2575867 RepID=A0A4U3L5J6_9BACT|nr:vanadium-dependent haloperoxidase [Ilyomonas limi]TKK70212.1 vanadium-dependent haloperoxidase [Ilyomonas limi]